ncbi:MAG: M13 family metallopeptidase [Acidobacteriota bacterium]
MLRCHLGVCLILSLTLTSSGWSQTGESPTQRPLGELPYTPSLDLAAMDLTIDPCVDLYQYACGGWLKNNPIPPDRARWSVYGKLFNDNLQFLWGILQDATDRKEPRSALQAKIGDYFAACMDEPAIDAKGTTPLQAELTELAAISDTAGLSRWLAYRHRQGQSFLFGFGSAQDLADASQVIAEVDDGGLSLPDRDYYLSSDQKMVQTRQHYREHLQRMFGLIGDSDDLARTNADTVLRLETALARASLTQVQRRDPYNLHHPMTVAKLQRLAPRLNWTELFSVVGAPPISRLNVTQPKFIAEVDRLLKSEPLSAWKTYLRWHLLHAAADQLSTPIVRAEFDFFSTTLRGVKEMQPRWKRCVAAVDNDLGEALGQVFVEKAFPPEVKRSTEEMVVLVQAAMKARVEALPWMGAKTKRAALEKLRSMRNKVGYPERFRDYTAIQIAPDDHFGNVERAAAFESARQFTKIGKPVDRSEWGMTPPTVNAYYNPTMNDMNFPAGILLPPLFDPKLDGAPNYGNTGSTIGHELTHGFDDEGSQFDALGNLRDWWTKRDRTEFERRAQCVADQYATYVIVDEIKINSKLTLGEDLADLGGTILAYEAWRASTANQRLAAVDGLTPDQRFFVGFAQWACENSTPESLRVNAVTNPHSPGKYRINGVVVNMPQFASAFGCKPGQPMVKNPEQVCRVW